MGLVALNLTTLNARGLNDPSKSVRLLDELSNLRIGVAAVQKTHFSVGCWRTIMPSFQHMAAAAALRSLC